MANYTTGQIVVDGMFVDPIDNQITFAGRVPTTVARPTRRPTSRPSASRSPSRSTRCTASAGVIVPGDQVNILVARTQLLRPARPRATATSSRSDTGQTVTPRRRGDLQSGPVLYQAAKVLFVDKTGRAPAGRGQQTGTNTATPNGAGPDLGQHRPDHARGAAGRRAQLIASIAPRRALPDAAAPELRAGAPSASIARSRAQLPGEDPSQLTPYGPTGIQNQR